MPPNHSVHLHPSKKSVISKRNNGTASLNHRILDDRFVDETFTVVQYVILSLVSQSVGDAPSTVAKRFRELVSEIIGKHEVYDSLCSHLDMTPANVKPNFNAVMESIFLDNHINWGRLVALVGFSVKVAEHFRCQGYGNYDQIVVELTANFLVHRTGAWILSQGGWADVVSHFANTASDRGQLSPRNNKWFKGFLVTATATLGFGAILAASCR